MSQSSNVHAVHPYPCKFPSFVAAEFLPLGGSLVVDPFCGSGTTLVEAAVRGNSVIGYDCNPIAVLISLFKLMPVDETFFAVAASALREFIASRATFLKSDADLQDFPGRDRWFGPIARRELGAIRDWSDTKSDSRLLLWLRVSLSAIVNRVSYQDSETRYARVVRTLEPGDVVDLFERQALIGLRRLRARPRIDPSVQTQVEVADIGRGIPLATSSVDTVVTSPPYANTMDYYLYHKQRMNVLGYDFAAVQAAELGSRREFSSLKAGIRKWRADYDHIIEEVGRVLRPTGRAVVIIGDSQIGGEHVSAAELTNAAAHRAGLSASCLASYPLANRSRSFNPAFRRPNKFEHIFELRKF